MKRTVTPGKFSSLRNFLATETITDEVEGAFLGVVKTFNDLGFKVSEGSTSPTRFTFYLTMDAVRRWFAMARMLIHDHRGYILQIGKMLYPMKNGLTTRWLVSIEADNIIPAADNFRKALYATWDIVEKMGYYGTVRDCDLRIFDEEK
jgi:hypothetical protein